LDDVSAMFTAFAFAGHLAQLATRLVQLAPEV
jgi:hypothetical protein